MQVNTEVPMPSTERVLTVVDFSLLHNLATQAEAVNTARARLTVTTDFDFTVHHATRLAEAATAAKHALDAAHAAGVGRRRPEAIQAAFDGNEERVWALREEALAQL